MENEKEQTILDIDPNAKLLVTCGNSKLGGNVLKYLLEKKVPPKNIITTVRDLSKGEKWQKEGIEIRIADYKNPESLIKAFTGVDRIYFVSSLGIKTVPEKNSIQMW